MRKRIGVFIGEISQEYQRTVVKAIVGRANSLGYDVVFICSYGLYNDDYLYAEGEKACIHLPDFSTFDGLIVLEDVFDIDDIEGMADELYRIISETASCPVVYPRTIRDNCYSLIIDNKTSIEDMTRHFTDVHGFTDICYMSGKKDSVDSQERLDGFLSVMAEKGIPVNDHMIFHGDFWRYRGKQAIDWFMQNRTNYPQAIICANDYMALSICEELRHRGVRVPQDVCISGFDYVDEAKVNIPTLTSLEVDFKAMSERAVDIINNVNNGKEEKHIQHIKAITRINSSCGCGEQYRHKKAFNFLEVLHHQTFDTKNVLLSATEYQDSFEFDEYMAVADKFRYLLRTNKAYFCFCDSDETGFHAVENDSAYSKHMILRRIFEEQKPAEKLNITFPRKDLLPDMFWSDDEPNNMCIFSIHFKNIIYGYIVAEIPENTWFDIYTQGYLMTLANAIQNGEVHKKMEQLEAIRDIYQKDALTGIFNRRGFDKQLRDIYTMSKTNGTNFALVSIDMDNLKEINDTYGHAAGDDALIILARSLSSAMKEGDFCARVGGDEFAAVIKDSYSGRFDEFKKEFHDSLKREGLSVTGYQVSASVGICEITEEAASSLVACVQIADERMYKEKRGKKETVR